MLFACVVVVMVGRDFHSLLAGSTTQATLMWEFVEVQSFQVFDIAGSIMVRAK